MKHPNKSNKLTFTERHWGEGFGVLLEWLFNHHNNLMFILKIRNQSFQEDKLFAQHQGGGGGTQTPQGGGQMTSEAVLPLEKVNNLDLAFIVRGVSSSSDCHV